MTRRLLLLALSLAAGGCAGARPTTPARPRDAGAPRPSPAAPKPDYLGETYIPWLDDRPDDFLCGTCIPPSPPHRRVRATGS